MCCFGPVLTSVVNSTIPDFFLCLFVFIFLLELATRLLWDRFTHITKCIFLFFFYFKAVIWKFVTLKTNTKHTSTKDIACNFYITVQCYIYSDFINVNVVRRKQVGEKATQNYLFAAFEKIVFLSLCFIKNAAWFLFSSVIRNSQRIFFFATLVCYSFFCDTTLLPQFLFDNWWP